jgi:CRP/FNR family transcriptional regulator, nitrogen fixation regulation protein
MPFSTLNPNAIASSNDSTDRPPDSRLACQLEMIGTRVKFARNAEIFGEGEPAEYLYKVVSGAVRTSKLSVEGRRQIGAFLLPGDVFGMEVDKAHRFSAEAVSDSVVLVVKRRAVETLAMRDTLAARELRTLAMRDLDRVREHMLVLGRKNAVERLATFLLDMAGRASTKEQVQLPMSRQDIADYLGLTIETVSRTLTQLENSATIALPSSRCVMLRNRRTLDRLAA